MPGHIGDDGKGEGGDDQRSGGETIEAICQVDGIAGPTIMKTINGIYQTPISGVTSLKKGQ